jgi:hypothetical protein
MRTGVWETDAVSEKGWNWLASPAVSRGALPERREVGALLFDTAGQPVRQPRKRQRNFLLHSFAIPTVNCNCDLSLNTVIRTLQPGMGERNISKRIDGANVRP